LLDEQFALLEPLLPKRKRTGRPPADLREVLNGILYLARSGCQWRLLPHDFPPWSTVHTWYRRWRKDGTWDRVNDALAPQVRRQAVPSRVPPGRGVRLRPVPAACGQPPGRRGGLGEVAAAVGGGTDLRLAGAFAAAEQGLREGAGVERSYGQGEYDPSHAPSP